ncbi:DUF1761 domain-containing protein [Cohnella faecalis]|uniref:DUF1761 domain-containing protein n=1 Tax=Cohnella faecalis TaxID=2315694 RepID=A0A398CT65_9BACL|nr:DUF1761 domain-containing protein [Cohnella faecalis]RIE02154.1 DUF1761 domain-containing protein [Cohnella faecalis]
MFHLEDINYVAVLAATVATMILGFLWYSPILFGGAWMKQIGKKAEDMSGGGPLTYVLTAATALIGSWILAAIVTLTDGTVGAGVIAGLLIGIVVSAKIGMNYLFEGRSGGLFIITSGYHVVSFLLSGLIIGAM